MKISKFIAPLAIAALAASSVQAQAPKREFRSIWMAAMGIDWPLTSGTTADAQAKAKQQLIDYLDNYQKHNFTGVCVHVRPLADALYRSSLEPWSASVSGTRGVDPGWDPLEFAVEECHKRGLECYAWVNPFRVDHNGRTYTTPQDNEWREKGWIFTQGDWTIFNPANPEARRHCLDVMKEIYSNYQIDGMLFDDYFYPGSGMPTNSTAPDYADYQASGTSMSIGDWRRDNVNTFVEEIYNEIQAARPDMRFGIGPAGVGGKTASDYGLPSPGVSSGDWMYDGIYCDPLAWLQDGTIDFISPQIYWARTNAAAPYEPLCKWWSDAAAKFGRHNYISMASYKVDTSEFGGNNETGWSEFSAQVDLARRDAPFSAPGQIYYSAKYFDGPTKSGLGQYLEEHSYTAPALVPIVDWKQRVNYESPAGAAFSGETLTWHPTEVDGRTIMRYTIYAAPLTTSIEEAASPENDGIDGAYLLGVSYDTSYTIPADKREGYWYAVCTYDGYGYESDPALVNYTGEPSEAAQPIAPADGAVVDWDVEFSWASVAEGTYRLQVATDAGFRNLIAEEKGITENSRTLDLGTMAENTTHYWRVLTNQPGKLTAVSSTATFTSPERLTAAPAVLTAPENGSTIDKADLTFAWEPVEGVETYTVVVAKEGNFDAPLLSRTINAPVTSLTIRSSSFGLGDFSWHVVADGRRIHPSTSANYTFKVEKLDIGANEPGYAIVTDPAVYTPADGISLENLWIRSVDNGNMKFETAGSLNRGMVATADRVYISGRKEASSSSATYLREFSAETGEHLRDIELGEDATVDFLPCNDVLIDSEGHICVANLSLNIATSPIYLHLVDLVSGEVKEVACLTHTSEASGRIDHVGIYGDVTSDQFVVFAAVASKPYIIRWVVRPDNTTSSFVTAQSFYPSTSGHFDIAPRVLPVSNVKVYVDGFATAPTLYNYSTGKISGSFESSPEAMSDSYADNGLARFAIGSNEYFAYSYESAYTNAKFAITAMDKKDSFAGLNHLWIVPSQGLGSVASGTASAPVSAVTIDDHTANIFVYSPGNGLAAYRITDNSGSVADAAAADAAAVSVRGREVVTAARVEFIRAYNVTGALVADDYDTDCLQLPAPGTYLIATPAGNTLVAVK